MPKPGNIRRTAAPIDLSTLHPRRASAESGRNGQSPFFHSTQSPGWVRAVGSKPRSGFTGERRALASCPTFCCADSLSRSIRQAGVVWQLHLGCPGNSRYATPERASSRCLWLLQLRNGARGKERKAALAEGDHPLCRACPALVPGHRFHLKDHAPVPVGTTRGPLVRTMESSSRRDHDFESRMASGQGMVQRSPESKMAAQDRSRSAGGSHGNWAGRRILEIECLSADRKYGHCGVGV